MIDYHANLVSALKTVLPTHYEMALTSKTATPCISYMELSNYDVAVGDTVGYSTIVYQVKVWANSVKLIQQYAKEVDKALKPLGFKRISSNELYDNNSTMIQKVMAYEALGREDY